MFEKNSAFPPVPTSPTLNIKQAYAPKTTDGGERPTTPVSFRNPLPSTPPRSSSATHQISSIRTPLSHRGLHMSPSASLVHFKTHLDPPPVYAGGAPLSGMMLAFSTAPGEDEDDALRTPRRRLTQAGGGSVFFGGPPVTPRRLLFPASGDSPFRTPRAGSPFRTPGGERGAILDPHDPRALLHEELNNRALDESPGGIFGKGRGALLYDSPGYDTHAKYW